ncbi:MAG: tyrosine-type recombinase/integrase, partial [Geminicoccaceae bacterium]
MARITDRSIRTLVHGQELRDGRLPGFGIRATCSGWTWFLTYQIATGSRRRPKVGTYPATELKEARARALRAVAEIERGHDPADRRSNRPKPQTLKEAFAEYRSRRLNRLRSGKAMAAVLERDLIAALGGRPLGEITRRDVSFVLDEVEERGSPVTANRLLQYTKAMFNQFVERGLLETSPVERLSRRTKELPRDRVLSPDELRRLWQACEVVGYPFGPFVRLLILTGLRRQELASAQREVLAGRILTIGKTKTGASHSVTLPRQAMEIVRDLPRSGLLFRSRVTGGGMSGYTKMRARLARAAGLNPRTFTLHDLRRTMASGMAALEVDPVVIELCLGHSPGGVLGRVGAIYNRHSYAAQCARAWQTWADHVAELAASRGPATVANTMFVSRGSPPRLKRSAQACAKTG